MRNMLGGRASLPVPTAELSASGVPPGGLASPGVSRSAKPKRHKRLRWAVAVVVVLGLSGGGYAYASTGSKSASYVLGAARLATVSQTVGVSGTLRPASTRTLDFPTGGVVSTVDVSPGQKVRAGQVLASLDTAPLQAQLASAQASLASAQARLTSDQAGPSASQLSSADAQVASARTALSNDITNLTVDEQALVTDQATLATAQATLTSGPGAGQPVPSYSTGEPLSATESLLVTDERLAVDDGTSTQPSVSSPSGGGAKGSGGSGSAGTTASGGAGNAGATGSSGKAGGPLSSPVAAVQAAVSAASRVVGNLEQVSSAQVILSDANAALSALSTPAPALTLTAARDAVTVAEDQVATAKADLAGAKLIAPAAAVVVAVNIAPGQPAPGAGSRMGTSSTGAIVLEDPSSFVAVADVSDAQIGEVHLGQAALVTAAGQTTPVSGSVSEITPTATTTSGVATYPVGITLKGDPTGLFDGMSAQVSIVVAQASHVVAVPSSAVHTVGSRNFVLVLRKGKRVTRRVKVGASGGGLTQITSGLSAGDQVVLANRRAPLPSGAIPRSGRGFGRFGGGRFGGGRVGGGKSRGGGKGGR